MLMTLNEASQKSEHIPILPPISIQIIQIDQVRFERHDPHKDGNSRSKYAQVFVFYYIV